MVRLLAELRRSCRHHRPLRVFRRKRLLRRAQLPPESWYRVFPRHARGDVLHRGPHVLPRHIAAPFAVEPDIVRRLGGGCGVQPEPVGASSVEGREVPLVLRRIHVAVEEERRSDAVVQAVLAAVFRREERDRPSALAAGVGGVVAVQGLRTIRRLVAVNEDGAGRDDVENAVRERREQASHLAHRGGGVVRHERVAVGREHPEEENRRVWIFAEHLAEHLAPALARHAHRVVVAAVLRPPVELLRLRIVLRIGEKPLHAAKLRKTRHLAHVGGKSLPRRVVVPCDALLRCAERRHHGLLHRTMLRQLLQRRHELLEFRPVPFRIVHESLERHLAAASVWNPDAYRATVHGRLVPFVHVCEKVGRLGGLHVPSVGDELRRGDIRHGDTYGCHRKCESDEYDVAFCELFQDCSFASCSFLDVGNCIKKRPRLQQKFRPRNSARRFQK